MISLSAAAAWPTKLQPEKPLIAILRTAVGHALAETQLLTDGLTDAEVEILTAATLALTLLTLAAPDCVLLSQDETDALAIVD
jgi:hypothetical protein